MADDDRLLTVGLIGLGLAHELNSPLTSTALSLELLIDRLDHDPPDAATLRAQLSENLARVRRMADLIRHFRALARGDTPHHAEIELGRVVTAACRLARPALQELTEVDLVQLPQPGATPAVIADPLLLEHAVLCLLLNAADVGHRVEVSIGVVDGQPSVHVDDDGPGIPEHADALGFSSKGSKGMGVGLPLVRAIAADAGATLEISTSPLGGARLSLAFYRVVEESRPG